MKLNRRSSGTTKTDFIGFKEEPRIAKAFRRAARAEGGASKVLQDFIREYLRKKVAV